MIRVEINWQGNQTALDRDAREGEKRKVEEVEGTKEEEQQLHENKFDKFVHKNSSREETICKVRCIHKKNIRICKRKKKEQSRE